MSYVRSGLLGRVRSRTGLRRWLIFTSASGSFISFTAALISSSFEQISFRYHLSLILCHFRSPPPPPPPPHFCWVIKSIFPRGWLIYFSTAPLSRQRERERKNLKRLIPDAFFTLFKDANADHSRACELSNLRGLMSCRGFEVIAKPWGVGTQIQNPRFFFLLYGYMRFEVGLSGTHFWESIILLITPLIIPLITQVN